MTQTSKRYSARLLAFLLVFVMLLGFCPLNPPANAIDETTVAPAAEPVAELAGVLSPVLDASITNLTSVYGFLADTVTIVDGNKISGTLIPAGKTDAEKIEFTTEELLGDYNDKTSTAYAEMLKVECTKGSFVELFYSDNKLVDVHQVLDASQVGFDTAQYGGDLTNANGGSGQMVAKGWFYGADEAESTIRIGDGNFVTNVFDENYKVDNDTKYYLVDDNYNSTESTYDAIAGKMTDLTDGGGEIYTIKNRCVAICVFADDYNTPYQSSVVSEMYVYETPYAVDDAHLYKPDNMPNHSDYRENNDFLNKNYLPQRAPQVTSAEPFCLVKDRLYWIGDDEVSVLLMVEDLGSGDYDLTVMDLGWPVSGYQYMKNIEKLGFDPRDVSQLALTHGHVDHYATANDFVDMVERAGGGTVTVYESKADTLGYDDEFVDDDGNPWNIAGALTDKTARYIITDFFPEKQWFDINDDGSIQMYAYINNGHSTGSLSFVIRVVAGADDEYFDEDDVIEFSYMGGYGSVTAASRGYLRNQFQYSLQYLQSFIVPMMENEADYIYCIPQHTNQYPILEVSKAYRELNKNKTISDPTYVPFMECMHEGPDAIINQLEKRFASSVYEDYFQKWKADTREIEYASDPDKGKVSGSSTNNQTNEIYGPFKRDAGEYIIEVLSDTTSEVGTIIHGYNAWQNPNSLFTGLTNIDNEDLSRGFVIEKDAYVHDPDSWYVQLCVRVSDDYTGNIKSSVTEIGDISYSGGPVESLHGDGWFEVIRSERFDTKAEAEALLATVTTGKYYSVNLDKSSEIQSASTLTDTFTLVSENPKDLPNAGDITVDYDDYYGQKIQGYYNFNCVVSTGVDGELGTIDDTVRTAKFYIPTGTVFNQPTVFVGVPNNKNTWDFLVESGWKDMADEYKLHIVLMEPVNGTWGTETEELAYIAALNEDVSYRPFFCAFSSNFYGIGYGECADLLQKHSVNNPKSWAAIAVIGASGMSDTDVTALQTKPSKVPGVSLAEAQTPIWIAAQSADSDNITNLINFYKNANHSEANAVHTSSLPNPQDIYIYKPQDGGTVDDEWCANVVVHSVNDWTNYVSKTYAEGIYTELFEGTYRYPGNANGALRRPGEIFSRGFVKYEDKVAGGFKSDGTDLYNREWYVYEPESVKDESDVPLVFVFHGAGGSGNEIADRSGWATVAEERGFIIVCPTGSISPSIRNVSNMQTNEYYRAMWNTGDATATRPSDLEFVEYLYDWMLENYDIDASRVYASGQSSGGMMTWACAAKLPNLFAAAAPISAYTSATPTGDSLVPIACYMGEQETTFRNGFSENGGKPVIDTYTELYKTTEKWDTYTYMGDDSKAPAQEGLFTKYVFNEKKAGAPVLLAVEVETKTHAIWPSECFDAWDNWFVNYTKNPTSHVLYYNGKAVPFNESNNSGGTSKPSTNPNPIDTTPKDFPFSDSANHWAKDAIEYVYDKGIMTGTTTNTFAPELDTTRGMIVTMLYRLEGSPAVSGDCKFTDVKSNMYYRDAIIWAEKNGVVKGISDSEFAPEENITREQLALMMYNYAAFKKLNVNTAADITKYKDAADVSDWALTGMKWAVGSSLVNGVGDNLLDPSAGASRAQVATIFHRFMENIAK